MPQNGPIILRVAVPTPLRRTFDYIFPENLIKKHLPKSFSTAKGHLQQERKNLRSTKTQKIPQQYETFQLDDTVQQDFFPASDEPNNKTYECFLLRTISQFAMPLNKFKRVRRMT